MLCVVDRGISDRLLERRGLALGWRDDFLGGFDEVYVTGQARSHCVLESLGSIVNYFGERPEVIDKVRFICLWNGGGGDAPGGTQHMYDEVNNRTGQVTWIDTRKIFGPA